MRTTARAGFTLIELMIVVAIIAIIAAIAIPSLLNARKAANEASAISGLRTLATVAQQYRTRFGEYPSGIDDLVSSSYVDGFTLGAMGVPEKSGYVWGYGRSGQNWAFGASPRVPGTTGDRFFVVFSDGVIRVSLTGPADSTSPPLD